MVYCDWHGSLRVLGIYFWSPVLLDMIRTERVGSWVLGYIDMVSAFGTEKLFYGMG